MYIFTHQYIIKGGAIMLAGATLGYLRQPQTLHFRDRYESRVRGPLRPSAVWASITEYGA